MKKTPSIRRRCDNCKFILRRRKVGGPQRRITCITARHKQVQG